MSQCSMCGSQDTKFISGISKKTGKPYSGYKCQEKNCGNLDFVKNQIKKPIDLQPFERLEKKIDLILKHLEITPHQLTTPTYEKEETPF